MAHSFQVKIAIDAPKNVSWAVIADYANVHKYVDGVFDSHLTTNKNQGVGCTRHCDLPKMMLMKQYIVEEITVWEEGESLTYVVTDTNAPIKDGRVKWRVSGDEFKSEIHADVYYKPKGIMGFLMSPMLRINFPRQLNQGLMDIKQHIESNAAAGRSAIASAA